MKYRIFLALMLMFAGININAESAKEYSDYGFWLSEHKVTKMSWLEINMKLEELRLRDKFDHTKGFHDIDISLNNSWDTIVVKVFITSIVKEDDKREFDKTAKNNLNLMLNSIIWAVNLGVDINYESVKKNEK
ncbi:MAG: hypothetical protein JW871_04270 [Endomicrobiales bacterium]|nr:hypothetical protein [Endomicrobiales bacterium]